MDLKFQLDERLVFSKFESLINANKLLYKNYLDIDETSEIARDWNDFSQTVVEHLLSVMDLTESLYNRIIDELKRSPEKVKPEDFKRIQSITDFWFDINVMGYAYATMMRSGILKESNLYKKTEGYVNTKLKLDELTLLAFKDQPSFTPEALSSLIELLRLYQIQKRLNYLGEIYDPKTFNEEKAQLLSTYDMGQFNFLLTVVLKRLSSGLTSWWWQDPIVMHSMVSHALNHMESMKDNLEKTTSDLAKEILDVYDANHVRAELLANAYLAQHYKTLAINALSSKDLESAGSYFQMAFNLINVSEDDPAALLEVIDGWTEYTLEEERELFFLSKSICELNIKYKGIEELIQKKDFKSIKKQIKDSENLIQEMLGKGDLQFISTFPLIYDNIFAYVSHIADEENGENSKKDLEFINSRFNSLEERLKVAFQHLTTQWMQALKQGLPPSQLTHINRHLDLLLVSFLLLPNQSEFTDQAVAELYAINEATEAIQIQSIAENEFGSNPVKELMMRAKSYFLIFDAISYCTKDNTGPLQETIETVLKPIAKNALLRGLIAEIQLRSALIQFTFINKIAVLIESSALGKGSGKPGIMAYDIMELDTFKSALSDILVALDAVLKNQAPIIIRGSLVNWDFFKVLKGNLTGAISFIEAIEKALNATVATLNKNYSEAISNWSSAKDLAYSSADQVGASGAPDAEGTAQQVYSIGTMFANMEQSTRDRVKTEPFPFEILIDTLQTLIMGSSG